MPYGNYRDDRNFTNIIHNNVAEPIIYKDMGWVRIDVNNELAEIKDNLLAVDYQVKDRDGNIIYVQERFRGLNYMNYNDFTIRFKREMNRDETQIYSEFFKMKSNIANNNNKFYMLYGFANERSVDFDKYIIVDLRLIIDLYLNKILVIDEVDSNIIDGELHAVHKYNHDDSSSFIAINVKQLNQICPEAIIRQKGYVL